METLTSRRSVLSVLGESVFLQASRRVERAVDEDFSVLTMVNTALLFLLPDSTHFSVSPKNL